MKNLQDRIGRRVALAGLVVDADRQSVLVRFDNDTRSDAHAVWIHHSIVDTDSESP